MPSSQAERSPASLVPQEAHAGRYTIIFNPNIRADMYLLDTETGKVWRPTQYTDVAGQPTVWLYMDRVDDSKQLQSWISEHSGG